MSGIRICGRVACSPRVSSSYHSRLLPFNRINRTQLIMSLDQNPSLHEKLSLSRLYSSLDYQVAPYSVAFATSALFVSFVSIPVFVYSLAEKSFRWLDRPCSLPSLRRLPLISPQCERCSSRLHLTSPLFLLLLSNVLGQRASLSILRTTSLLLFSCSRAPHTDFNLLHRRTTWGGGRSWSVGRSRRSIFIERCNFGFRELTLFLKSDFSTTLVTVPKDEEED